VLVVNGDVVTHVNYQAVRDYHLRHNLDATIAIKQHDTTIPFGVIRQTEDGLLEGIDEKPTLKHFIAAGIYYISPAIIELIPKNVPLDMPVLLNRAKSLGLRIGLFPVHEYWKDVGHPEDLNAANNDIT
jgi:NDP-sugar pyrophosphorylase family protein